MVRRFGYGQSEQGRPLLWLRCAKDSREVWQMLSNDTFWRRDDSVVLANVMAFFVVRLKVANHLFEVVHGFNCDRHAQCDTHSAALGNNTAKRVHYLGLDI